MLKPTKTATATPSPTISRDAIRSPLAGRVTSMLLVPPSSCNGTIGNSPFPFMWLPRDRDIRPAMITDARVLSDDFVPPAVQHRGAEVDQLTGALEPAMGGETPENVLMLGPSGAGKTCLAQYSLEELREQTLDVEHQYVNCWQDYNRFSVLYRVLEGVGRTFDVHRQSTPKDELLDRLRDYEGSPYVVILDEVDQLQDTGVLYDLYALPRVAMILIANREEELLAGIDDRVASRLQGSRRVPFEQYRVHELADILEDRAEWGLHPDAVDRARLEQIADAAAGDARVAINVLRSAAREAESRDSEVITEEIVEAAVPEAREDVRQKNAEQLTSDQQAIYEVVQEAGEISPGELYERYEDRVDDPVTKRTVRNYLSKMQHYNLVEAEGDNRARTYRAVEG